MAVITAEEIACRRDDVGRRAPARPGRRGHGAGRGQRERLFARVQPAHREQGAGLVDGRTEYQELPRPDRLVVHPGRPRRIDRIEVIRGPGSALYGANAMLGVINIITKAPGPGRPPS